MQVSTPNNVKIYNLSAGKSLPEVTCKLVLNCSCYRFFFIVVAKLKLVVQFILNLKAKYISTIRCADRLTL